MAEAELVVGIDLGTTFSEIAYVNDEGRPEIIKVDNEPTMPSVVLYNEDGTVTVGEEALRQAIVKTHRVVQWIKRSMGEEFTRFIPKSDSDIKPHTDESGQVVTPEGKEYTPEEVSAEILRKLVQEAQSFLGRPVRKAIITCPAWFTDKPRKATEKAGELAGLEVLRIVNEPTAAAVYYGLDKLEDGQIVAVYDLGGGTFDCSIIEYQGGELKHLASDGNRELGGHDWTTTLMEQVAEKMEEQFGKNPLHDPLAKKQLYENCERAKRAFSGVDRQQIACTLQEQATAVEVTREEFEQWTEPHVAATLDYTEKAVQKAKKSWSDVNHLLLVGGSTRLRRVAEALEQLTGKPPIKTGMEDTMVALGAAALTAKEVKVGHGRRAKLRPVRIRETTPHALGVLVNAPPGGELPFINRVIIDEGMDIPVERSRADFKTNSPEFFDVPVLQGSSPDYRSCAINYTYRFKCLPDTPPGSPIKITFAYNASNQIVVQAVDAKRGQTLQGESIPFTMPQACSAVTTVDLCFVVDATGSMAGCIDGVKRGISDFCNQFTQSNLNYRLSLVEYRDEKIGEALKTYDWTTDVAQFRNWVSGLYASGGGDEPESALDGIVAASSLQARGDAAKVVVLITDASSHDPDQQGRTAHDVARMLSEQKIKLFAIAPPLPAYQMLADKTGGKISNFRDYFSVGSVDPRVFSGVLTDLGSEVANSFLR